MKIHYVLYAHVSREHAWDEFENACALHDYSPYQQEMDMSTYIGQEIELLVEYDTETKKFKTTIDTK